MGGQRNPVPRGVFLGAGRLLGFCGNQRLLLKWKDILLDVCGWEFQSTAIEKKEVELNLIIASDFKNTRILNLKLKL